MKGKYLEFLEKCKCVKCRYKDECFDPMTRACSRFEKEDGTWPKLVSKALETGEEIETATWLWNPNGMDWNLPAWECSECHGRNDNIPATMVIKGKKQKINPYAWAGSKYCPNCGRRMVPQEMEEA